MSQIDIAQITPFDC